MIATLRPCTSCNRHVRYSETQCPFCGAPLAHQTPRRLPDLSRLSRAAQLAVGAAFLASCASDPGGGPGTPPPMVEDAGATSPETPEQPVAMYGMPPPPDDTAPVQPQPAPTATQSPPPDAGLARPLYGMPPPR